MAYNPSWSTGTGGRIVSPNHSIHLVDAEEIGDALDRRRRIAFWSGFDFSADLFAGAYVKGSTFGSFRSKIVSDVWGANYGALGGSPPTPLAVDWVWPIDDGDKGTKLTGAFVFDKLNGTGSWGSSVAAKASIEALDINELRQVIEWTRDGDWELPNYNTAGILSSVPDTPWIGDVIANDGVDELQSVGWAVVHFDDKGIQNATARSSSIVVSVDTACTVQVYHVDKYVDFDNPPSWNSFGGLTGCTSIGSASCSPGSPGTISGASTALQNMIDGSYQNFLFRRSDTGVETITFSAVFHANFTLDTTPN